MSRKIILAMSIRNCTSSFLQKWSPFGDFWPHIWPPLKLSHVNPCNNPFKYLCVCYPRFTVNWSHYFELLDLMLKMGLDTLIGESSPTCLPLGATWCPLLHKDLPWGPWVLPPAPFTAHCVCQLCGDRSRGPPTQPSPKGPHPMEIFWAHQRHLERDEVGLKGSSYIPLHTGPQMKKMWTEH